MKGNKQRRFVVMALLLTLLPLRVYADTSSSTNYRVEQTFFGSGGELEACSTSFCSKQTLGELAIGNTTGTLYQAYAGFNTTEDPFLEFYVTSSDTDIGVLDSASATTTTGQFYVRAWQAGGYVVQTRSDPPSSGSNQLTPMAGGASTPGTEGFGINLVKNTALITGLCPSGCDVGVDPVQVPDASFSFGHAQTGYDTDGVFKYNKGDTIASSQSSTSVTVYTVSYLFNISDVTAAGKYIFRHNMVATATY